MAVKLLFILLALTLHLSVANPTKKSNYIEQENSCREVCGLCDCDGFYCEDECICECSIQDEDNLQCIADMKDECDKNGLEYELLMQDTAKERYLRQVKTNKDIFSNLNKNFVIMKQKRDSEVSTAEENVGAPAPEEEETKDEEDQKVGAPGPKDEGEEEEKKLGFPITAAKASAGGKLAIAGLSGLTIPKILVNIREILTPLRSSLGSTRRPTRRPTSTARTVRPFTLPPTARPFSIPTARPLSFNLNSIITQPLNTL